MKPLIFTFIILIGGINGCSSTRDEDVVDNLQTEIRPDGSKRFVFTVHYINNDKQPKKMKGNNLARGAGRQDGRKQSGNRRGNKAPNSAKTKENPLLDIFEDRLFESVALKRFCLEGYFELGRVVERNQINMRGECNESASEKEIKQLLTKSSD